MPASVESSIKLVVFQVDCPNLFKVGDNVDNDVDDPETNKLLKSALLFKFEVVIFTFSLFLPKEEN